MPAEAPADTDPDDGADATEEKELTLCVDPTEVLLAEERLATSELPEARPRLTDDPCLPLAAFIEVFAVAA